MKTMQKGFTLIELMIVVAIIAILAAIAIPAYQNYLIRAQVAEGMSLVGAAKTGVAEYYGNYGSFPSTNASAGITAAASISGNYVSGVAISTGGLITATFSGPKVNTNISGKTLILSPIANGGSINWTCSTTSSVPQQYLPATCR
jgi:type IV pilus assembly protein PilA